MLLTLMICMMCLHNIVYEHFQDYVNRCYNVTRHKGFKIGCLNIGCLLNKMDEMRTIVTECNFDIMGICF